MRRTGLLMTDVTAVWPVGAALIAGLSGSLHCVGMCGGIAGALAVRNAGASGGFRWHSVFAHHVGRLVSYTVVGGLAGVSGGTLQSMYDPARLGSWLRLGTAVLIILLGLRLALRWNAFALLERVGGQLWARIAPAAGRIATRSGPLAPLGLGALWGFLPCGLVYSLLLLAALTGTAIEGALVMLVFGVGTLPAMLMSSLLSARVIRHAGRPFTRAVAALMLVSFGLATAVAPVRQLYESNESHTHVHSAMPRGAHSP